MNNEMRIFLQTNFCDLQPLQIFHYFYNIVKFLSIFQRLDRLGILKSKQVAWDANLTVENSL